MSNPSHKRTLLDLFKRGLISQEELEAGLIDTASSPSAGDTSKPAAVSGEYRSLSGHETKLGQIRVPQAGDVLTGLFRLNRPIGRGAMGVVWLADDLPGKRAVCVKLLPPEVQHDLTELGRVREMFQKVHALQHQHLCPLYLLGSDPLCGEFLVMKYVDGQTLSEYRRSYIAQNGEFPLTEVVRVLTPVAEALDYVHSQGLIHRDVKPANIMVSRDGQTVQLVDLGLAAEIQGSMSRVSKAARDIAGTAPYMAPEQWNGDPLDGKCDQYALAMVAYQLIAGKLPWDVTSEVAWMNCAQNRERPMIQGATDSVNRSLARGLAKARAERFSMCIQFMKAIKSNSISTSQVRAHTPGKVPVLASSKASLAPPLQSAKAPPVDTPLDLRSRLIKTPYDRQLRTEYLRSRTIPDKNRDVREARNGGRTPRSIGCIVVIFILTIIVAANSSGEPTKTAVSVGIGVVIMATVQFIYRNIMLGRRCFLAERNGPIPQGDLDLSVDEFDKLLI